MLKGTLDDFTLPDIFQFLSSCRKTGSLEIQRSAGEGRVFFKEGEVYCAESSLSRDPLGQKLVRTRAITDVQLRQALDRQAESGGRLGEVLIEQGAISHEQIEGAVRQQMEDAVFDLLRWEAGEFTYQPGVEIETEVPLSVSIDNLVMEASRKLEELEEIRSRIPSEYAVLAMTPMPPEGAAQINITPEEWRMLVLVNGARTIAEIAESVGADNFSAMRTFFGLASTGLVEVIGEAEPAALSVINTNTDEPTVVEPEPETFEETAQESPMEMETVEDPVEASVEEPVAEPIAKVLPAAEEPVEEPPEQPDGEPFHAMLTDEKPSAFDELDALEATGDLVPPTAEAAGNLVPPTAEAAGNLVPPTAEAAGNQDGSDALEDAAAVEEDPFAAELLTPETNGTSPSDIPVENDFEPTVDRLAAVKELADLFDQTDSENVVSGPPYPAEIEAAAAAEAEAAEHEPLADVEGDGRRRVEDDEEITRGLISRLIDGVKGL